MAADKISVFNAQAMAKLNARELKETAASALSFLGEKAKVLSVYIVDDAEIKALNRKYLRRNRPTDVIAFSMSEGKHVKGAEGILGDVVVSAETAQNTAKQLGKKVKDEINLYLVHGILHLVGYDDNTDKARCKMQKLQEKILERYEAKKHSREF